MNTYSDKNRHPCGAVREGDWVVIAIHKNTIKNATELNQGLEHYSDEQEDYVPPKVVDLDQFIDDLVDELNREEEDGSTLITKALDDAVVNACENGSEAIFLGTND
jgi:protein-tyrosine phosphatase